MSRVGKRRRRRVGRVVIVATAATAVTAAAVTASGIGLTEVFGEHSSGSQDTTRLPPATAKVTQQTLVDTKTVRGDLGYGETTKVSGRLAGTLTGLPATGATVSRGEALYRVDNAPVVLLYGTLPTYRDLSAGTAGADVKQFEENLYELGYRGFPVDENYSGATAAAVRKWQQALGLAQTGTVDLGRVLYTPAAVRVESHQAKLGDPVGGPEATVLTYTGQSQVVTVELSIDYRQRAKNGAAVTVTLPDGKKVPGKISGTTTVIKPATSQGEQDTTIVKVTVTVDDPTLLAGIDQAALDVAFIASERENVLTVPVAALLALPQGGYGIELVEGNSTRTVAVKTGMFAGGRVEVSGEGVTEGAAVGIPVQ